MEIGRAQRDRRSRRSDWEKLNTLHGAGAPQLHGTQSSCDRRYCDLPALIIFAERAFMREHSLIEAGRSPETYSRTSTLKTEITKS